MDPSFFNGQGRTPSTQSDMLPASSNMDLPAGYPFYSQYNYPAVFTSPVSSIYPNGSYFGEMAAGISETSPPSDPSSQKHRSPEEEAKYRIKRYKNNEAAKASRKKRSDREKQLQEENNQLKQEMRSMAEQIQFLRTQISHFQQMMQQPGVAKGENKENVFPYLAN